RSTPHLLQPDVESPCQSRRNRMTDFLPEDLLTSTDDGEYEPRRLLDSIAAEVMARPAGLCSARSTPATPRARPSNTSFTSSRRYRAIRICCSRSPTESTGT